MYKGRQEYVAVVNALIEMGFNSPFSVEEREEPPYEEGYVRIDGQGKMSYGSQSFFLQTYGDTHSEQIYKVDFEYTAKLTLPKPDVVLVAGILFKERDVIAALTANGVLAYNLNGEME
jgi:hypothetical protein